MDPTAEQFFHQQLVETKIQFDKSDVKHKQQEMSQKWNYAVCATPIQKSKGVIFGINWGGNNMDPQSKMPDGSGIKNYRFIKQSRALLEEYWGVNIEEPDFNYTNLCSFRSPRANQLTDKDYELSLPLFEKYIRYIQPPWIISLGRKNVQMLQHFGVLKNIQPLCDHTNKHKGYSGELWESNFFSVPHPGARLTSASRKEIWAAVSREMRKIETEVRSF